MITMSELLKGKDLKSLPKEHQDNLAVLLARINKIRAAWGKPLTVTSGYRSMDEHLKIYEKMGIPKEKVPMKSNHLKGAAVDLSDPDGKLFDWTKANEKLLEEIGLWCEVKDQLKRVHYQIFPPASKSRFFKP